MPELIRTLLLVFMAAVSILCIILPPNYLLWQIKIVVSEYSHIPVLITLLLFLVPGFHRQYWMIPQVILLLTALSLFLFPVYEAGQIAGKLPQELEKSFGPAEVKTDPFSVVKMFRSAPDGPLPTTLTYYSDGRRSLDLDFYQSQEKKAAPLVIVIHGGGWDSGNKSQMETFNRVLAANGYNVAAINYSLAPDFQSPQQLDDVQHCIDFLSANAGKYQVDTSRIVLLGRSAGGQIALQAGYSLHLPQIKGIVAFYSPADMVWGYSLSTDNSVLKSKTLITQYMGGTLDEVRHKYEDATAMTHVTPSSPPTLMIHGLKDNMVAYGHNLHLIKTLTPNHVPHYLLSLPWATHGADYHLNGPSGQLSTYAVLHFLTAVTQAKG
ncbi:MAG: alpha/beta hydrolase [Bacteroidota bacterium]